MITLQTDESADSHWNKRLIESDFATESQIVDAAFQFSSNNQIPKFLLFLNNNGDVLGQLLLSEVSRLQENPHRKKNITNRLSKFSKILSAFNVKTKMYRWAYGPIVFNQDYSCQIYSKLSEYLLSKNSHQVVGWQHPFQTSGLSSIAKNFSLTNWSTFVIDLSKSKDELFNNIEKNSGRKNIQRAIKNGIIVEQINDKNLFEYFELLNSAKSNRGGLKNNFEYFSKVWKMMEPYGRKGFLAKKGSKPISGLYFSSLSGHMIENGVARSLDDKTNAFYSQDLLRWKIIEWGLENNMKWYNLAGFNPNPTSDAEKGILRYKQKWGGKKIDYYGIHLR